MRRKVSGTKHSLPFTDMISLPVDRLRNLLDAGKGEAQFSQKLLSLSIEIEEMKLKRVKKQRERAGVEAGARTDVAGAELSREVGKRKSQEIEGADNTGRDKRLRLSCAIDISGDKL